jgi:hypothetical protein
MSVTCNEDISYIIVIIDGIKYIEIAKGYQHKCFIDYIGRNTVEQVKYYHDNDAFFIEHFSYPQFINNHKLYPSQIFSLTDSNYNVYPISKSRDLLVWLIKFIDRVDKSIKHYNSINDFMSNDYYDSSIYFL